MNNQEELLEFSPSTDNVSMLKDIIKTQGQDVCRQQISIDYIRDSSHIHDFGIARITPRAVIGQRQTRRHGDRYHLWGFILCKIDFEFEMVTVELVCARPNSGGTGKLLIEMAEEKARQEGLKMMRLLCLPDDKLRSFYRRLGYRQVQMGVAGSNLKLYEMRKRL